MAQVFRYTDKVQEMLKCKVKAEPWLHVAIIKHPKTKGKAWYMVYVWDTRKVLAEGIVPNFNADHESMGPGRYDGKYNFMQYARDNGKPLQGGKYDVGFDTDDQPMQIKISKPGLVKGRDQITDAGDDGNQRWLVGMTINGVPVGFPLEAQRFGVRKMGIQLNYEGKADVAGKTMQVFGKGKGTSGYYGMAISFKPTLIQSKKSESFIGYRYKLPKLAQEFAKAFEDYANQHPEDFATAFKKAIKAIPE